MKATESKDKSILLADLYLKKYGENQKFPAIAAIVNNHLRPLYHKVNEDDKVKFIDINDKDGRRIYMNSLTVLFTKAVSELFHKKVIAKHSLQKGIYFEIENKTVNKKDIDEIKNRIYEYITQDIKIERNRYDTEEAKEKLYEAPYASGEILEYKPSKTTHLIECGDLIDYYYGYTVPSASYLGVFELKVYHGGVVLLGPSEKDATKPVRFKPQPKLFHVYTDAARWGKIMGVQYAYDLNTKIEDGSFREIIRITEAAHEKKICEIADEILEDTEKGRIILIAGPSSSGKTSFAHRLEIQLKVNGLNPVTISMDNYFVDREFTPRDENGEYDFETVDAIDIPLFNQQLEELIAGEEVNIPEFDFIEGKKYFKPENILKVGENQPIIIEGIHGLNPKLTAEIPDGNKFRIYVSPLTQINLDNHNKVSTSDLRIIRRMARDTRTRGRTPKEVIEAFDKLRIGEEKYIFPYQENADVMFNSALIYELAVLKKIVYPMLMEIKPEDDIYREARRLAKFLQFFESIELEKDIPPTSIIREFIGGSTLVEE